MTYRWEGLLGLVVPEDKRPSWQDRGVGYDQSLCPPQSISGLGILSIRQRSSQCLRLLKPDISVSFSDGASFIGRFFSRQAIAC